MSFSAIDIALTAFVALILLTFVLLIWELGFRRAMGRRRVHAVHPPEHEPARLEVVGDSRRAA